MSKGQLDLVGDGPGSLSAIDRGGGGLRSRRDAVCERGGRDAREVDDDFDLHGSFWRTKVGKSSEDDGERGKKEFKWSVERSGYCQAYERKTKRAGPDHCEPSVHRRLLAKRSGAVGHHSWPCPDFFNRYPP